MAQFIDAKYEPVWASSYGAKLVRNAVFKSAIGIGFLFFFQVLSLLPHWSVLALSILWMLSCFHWIRLLHHSEIYEITQGAILKECGVLNHQKEMLDLDHIENIEVKQTLFERTFFRTGTIHFLSATNRFSNQGISFEGIEDPDIVADSLRQVSQELL